MEKEARRSGLKLRPGLITGWVVAALIVAASALVLYIINKDSLVLREPVMVSLLGEQQAYTGKTTLFYDDKTGEVTLKNENRSLLLSGAPVYCTESGSLVLSRKMAYSNYRTGLFGRVNHFAKISYKDDMASIYTGKGSGRQLKDGYLFDGKNTYLFLEPVTVSWGEERISLSPLSAITVYNQQGFYYYSYEDGASGYVSDKDSTVYGTAEDGRYVLNMSDDLVDLDSGKSMLLPPDPDMFELLK